MMIWIGIHLKMTPEHLGFLPQMLDEDDPRPAREQFHERYKHGGGWDPFPGFTLDEHKLELHYPEDPPTEALAYTRLRDEIIVLFQHSWVVIIQQDGTFEVSRMD